MQWPNICGCLMGLKILALINGYLVFFFILIAQNVICLHKNLCCWIVFLQGLSCIVFISSLYSVNTYASIISISWKWRNWINVICVILFLDVWLLLWWFLHVIFQLNFVNDVLHIFNFNFFKFIKKHLSSMHILVYDISLN